jgi:D-sedoheptulose 7-phosphate isomerase
MKTKTEKILYKMIEDTPRLEICLPQIRLAYEMLKGSFAAGGKLMVCGNGGSAADSEHIVGELMKSFILERRIPENHRGKITECFPEEGRYIVQHLQSALLAIALTGHAAYTSAYINDVAADMVFVQQVYGYIKEHDVVMGLSTSGNSGNVINALMVGKAFGAKCIGMTGSGKSNMNRVCDVIITAPAKETYRVQEYHIIIYHGLCAMLEAEFFYSNQSHGYI